MSSIRMAEDTVSSKVTDLLGSMTHGWEFATKQKPFVDHARETDIIALCDGRETVVIEAKSYNVKFEKGVKQLRKRYFGERLDPDFQRVSNTLETGMVLRYPESVQSKISHAELEEALIHTDEIDYCVVTSDGEGNFPKKGYAKGSLRDIATALHIGASPTKKIREVTEAYKVGMKEWAADIERSTKTRPKLGEILSEILGKDADVETCKTACVFIIDAFIFQDAVAGKDGFEDVRRLAYYADDVQINYKGIIRDWARILEVNYVPIFLDALAIVKTLRNYDTPMARRVLKGLLKTSVDISESHLQQVHEIGGELFQELVVDRDNVKAHYTIPESAALLSALVCPKLPDDGRLPKVADYACGTGALLNGVYKRIQQLYEEKTGESSVAIHREMVENNLAASDIYSHATHLTFTAMAATHPTTTLGKTRVITAPYGEVKGYGFLTGSLELLDSNQLLFHLPHTRAKQIVGDDVDVATIDYKRDFHDGEMDIVIINPPFAKNADGNSKKGKAAFKAKDRSKEDEKEMMDALKEKSPRIASGHNGLGSWFVDMVDRKLKTGGTMGFILTSTILMGTATKQLRKMFAEEYHDVIVVTIAQNSGYASAFSHDTNLAECMVVATKGVGANTGRAKFVCLTERPDSLLTAQTLANLIRRQNANRRLEDLPNGGDELRIGEQVAGYLLDAPIDENEWAASNMRAFSLLQIGRQLREGSLYFPRLSNPKPIPMCAIGDIAETGYSHNLIKDETQNLGAFQVREGQPTSADTYPMLWKVRAETQRSMHTAINANARIQPGKDERAHEILMSQSHTHYHLKLGFPANSVLASWTEEATIGVNTLTNVVLNDPKYDKVWTLWTNSTLGLLCHWISTSKQQPGRGQSSLGHLLTIPTLDVRELTPEQLDAAKLIFDELKDARMLPYNECATDPWRHILDARLLVEVFGITDEETHRAMQTLREMLCDEPTIAATKNKRCCFIKDRAKAKKNGWAYDYDDEAEANALTEQKEKLMFRYPPIHLPAHDDELEDESSLNEQQKLDI